MEHQVHRLHLTEQLYSGIIPNMAPPLNTDDFILAECRAVLRAGGPWRIFVKACAAAALLNRRVWLATRLYWLLLTTRDPAN